MALCTVERRLSSRNLVLPIIRAGLSLSMESEDRDQGENCSLIRIIFRGWVSNGTLVLEI